MQAQLRDMGQFFIEDDTMAPGYAIGHQYGFD
jgi:hypothetical protein